MKPLLTLMLVVSLLAGCATSTIESRKKERAPVYGTLTPEERELVDQGQIKVGMGEEAVYIAWGRPSQVLQGESGTGGVTTTWLYHGTWMEETRYWNFREVPHPGGVFLERYVDRDYNPRDYVSAEIVFAGGRVARWRTLPRPAH